MPGPFGDQGQYHQAQLAMVEHPAAPAATAMPAMAFAMVMVVLVAVFMAMAVAVGAPGKDFPNEAFAPPEVGKMRMHLLS
jgi:hypothetical protein